MYRVKDKYAAHPRLIILLDGKRADLKATDPYSFKMPATRSKPAYDITILPAGSQEILGKLYEDKDGKYGNWKSTIEKLDISEVDQILLEEAKEDL